LVRPRAAAAHYHYEITRSRSFWAAEECPVFRFGITTQRRVSNYSGSFNRLRSSEAIKKPGKKKQINEKISIRCGIYHKPSTQVQGQLFCLSEVTLPAGRPLLHKSELMASHASNNRSCQTGAIKRFSKRSETC